MKVYLYETFHRCESITDWTPTGCTLALSSTQKVERKYSIKMTSDAGDSSLMIYDKSVDWSEFHDIIFSVYHPGWTNEVGAIQLISTAGNWKKWNFNFAASWTERTIDLTSAGDTSLGTLDLSNINNIYIMQSNPTTPGEDFYFDFFRGRSMDITSDIVNSLSFIECPIRDFPKLEFMAKGTWEIKKDYSIVVYDYLTSNGSTTAEQIIFEGTIVDYELSFIRKIWCHSRAKRDLDEFRPSGDYNGDLDSNHIKTLIAECSYITEGTIDATTGNTDNTFAGDKTFRTILNDWADKHYKQWYLSPTGVLTFNDADIDSGVVLHHHKATYNFRDETDGESGTDIEWIDSVGVDDSTYSAVITAIEDGHRKIIKFLCAGDNGKYVQWRHNHDDQTDDGTTIEFWFKYIDNGVGNHSFTFDGISGGQDLIIAYISSATNTLIWYYGNGAGGSATDSAAVVADTWTHVRIEFDFTNDTYDMWLNGIKEADGLNFMADRTDTGLAQYSLSMSGFGGSNSGECYVDAIGHSWDADYAIGDNLKGELFQCWNVKPKKHVDAINWVMLLGGIVDGVQISAESKDQNSIDELGAKI